MLKKTWIVAVVAITGLSACGDTLGEQALLGAGAGAAAGAVTGGDVVTGAVVGGAGNVAYCRSTGRCN